MHWQKLSNDWQSIVYQSLPINSYLNSSLCNYFLSNFVKVFIIKVTVKENSFN